MADLFDNIVAWLLDRALSDESIESTVSEFCSRLVEGGVPLARVSVGRTVLHPVIGLMDMAWDRETGKVETKAMTREIVRRMTEFNAPFGTMSCGETDRIFADLTDPADVARYPLFADLAEQGMTAYIAAGRTYGHRQELLEKYGKSFRGGSVSSATKRFSGFSKTDLEGLERLIAPFCVVYVSRMIALSPTNSWGPIWAASQASKSFPVKLSVETGSRSTAPFSILICVGPWIYLKSWTPRPTSTP
ncbi:MAG: hypothetical protein AAFS01_09220 [Pseudomonadota bacterium]